MAEMMMVAGAMQAMGALAQGQSQRQAYNFNADIYRNEAKQAQAAGQFASQQNRARTDRLLSQQRAQIAKSGFDIGGSPLLLMAETAYMGSIEDQMINWQANMQAQNMQRQAQMARQQGKNATTSSLLSAGGSLLGAQSMSGGMSTPGMNTGGIFNGKTSIF